MSIASAIVAAQGRVADAYTAISNKGGTLPATQNLANMPAAINSIPSGSTPSGKYGASVDTFLGDVDANGVLQAPTEDSDLIFTGVKDIVNYGLYYKCSYSGVKSISFPDLIEVSGVQACGSIAYQAQNLSSMSFDNLVTISGQSSFSYMAYFSQIKTITFPKLSILSGMWACQNMLAGLKQLTDAYFPALTTTSFVNYLNQFQNLLSSTGTDVTHTLHFPSNLSSTISGLTGYPLFGGTSGYVTLAFDLPATS